MQTHAVVLIQRDLHDLSLEQYLRAALIQLHQHIDYRLMILFLRRDDQAVGTLLDHHAARYQSTFTFGDALRRLLSSQLRHKTSNHRAEFGYRGILQRIGAGDRNTLGCVEFLDQFQNGPQLGGRCRHQHDTRITISRHGPHQTHRGECLRKRLLIDILRADRDNGDLVIRHSGLIHGKAAHLGDCVLHHADVAVVLNNSETAVLQNGVQQINRLWSGDRARRYNSDRSRYSFTGHHIDV